MRVNGGSELARMQMLQRQAVATRNRLDVAAKELTTNLKANRFEASGGNLTRLFALERSLDRNAVFSQTISLTELRLEIMQESFGQMLKPAEDLALDLTQAAALGDYSGAMLHATTARSAFVDAVGLLNTQVAGQSLFAGTETDSAALVDAEAILADLSAAVAGATTAADAIAAVDAYFASPAGGFFTSGLRRRDRRPDPGRHRRGPAARLRDARRRGRGSSRCCAPTPPRRWSPTGRWPATRPSGWR